MLWSGETQKVLEWRELQDYLGERAQRGAVLKRGWPRKIDRMEVQLPAARAAKRCRARARGQHRHTLGTLDRTARACQTIANRNDSH